MCCVCAMEQREAKQGVSHMRSIQNNTRTVLSRGCSTAAARALPCRVSGGPCARRCLPRGPCIPLPARHTTERAALPAAARRLHASGSAPRPTAVRARGVVPPCDQERSGWLRRPLEAAGGSARHRGHPTDCLSTRLPHAAASRPRPRGWLALPRRRTSRHPSHNIMPLPTEPLLLLRPPPLSRPRSVLLLWTVPAQQ